MIVNQINEGWEIIYQRSHAMLAMRLTALWREEYRPERWYETLAATLQHDDEERFWDKATHLTENGMPLDFVNATTEVGLMQARYTVQVAKQQSRWVALMISKHKSVLLEGRRGESKELDQFLDEQKAFQEDCREAFDISQEEIDCAYTLLHWGDRLSLILCRREVPAMQRTLEVYPGPDGAKHEIMQHEDGTLQLTPWVWTLDRVTLSIETRQLTQPAFTDEAEFLQALESAPVITREWAFAK